MDKSPQDPTDPPGTSSGAIRRTRSATRRLMEASEDDTRTHGTPAAIIRRTRSSATFLIKEPETSDSATVSKPAAFKRSYSFQESTYTDWEAPKLSASSSSSDDEVKRNPFRSFQGWTRSLRRSSTPYGRYDQFEMSTFSLGRTSTTHTQSPSTIQSRTSGVRPRIVSKWVMFICYAFALLVCAFCVILLIMLALHKYLIPEFCVESIGENYTSQARQPECGVGSKIFHSSQSEKSENAEGVDDSEPGEFPWIAMILIRNYESSFEGKPRYCGGTVIHEKYVLTAAHCCYAANSPDRLCVEIGEYNTESDSDCIKKKLYISYCASRRMSFKVDNYYIPEDYNITTYANDICLVKLTREIPFSDSVHPACLPTYPEMHRNPIPGEELTTVGWGPDKQGHFQARAPLQKLNVKKLHIRSCTNVFSKDVTNRNVNIDDSIICAGNSERVNACLESTGGPLMYKYDNGSHIRYYVVGVSTLGIPCVRHKYMFNADRFAMVHHYMPWITNIIKTSPLRMT